ncbi:hypothetical protein SCLCIDRAFT_690942 [Scleroderma citrinum Foug A]|uniref:Uncharacterized protein n=1 Tax=Scleroderma citrinum Foug A TaxID=1036808 RepID=A0A0C3DT72_9AGAM|nr:hypothetical protein SCLCIDRAFT_690942 [Scleroderma citrinum Foug A]
MLPRGRTHAQSCTRSMDHSMTSSPNLKKTPPRSPVQISINDAIDDSAWFDTRLVQGLRLGLRLMKDESPLRPFKPHPPMVYRHALLGLVPPCVIRVACMIGISIKCQPV